MDYHQRFTGSGLEYDLLCPQCKGIEGEIESILRHVCLTCFEEVECEGCWDGIIGRPEIRNRNSNLRFEYESIELPELAARNVVAIQPIHDVPNEWAALTLEGEILRLDVVQRRVVAGPRLPEGIIDLGNKLLLLTTRKGDFIAVAERHGQNCVVLDAITGQTKLLLYRDDYHNEHSDFPVAFVEVEGSTLLIHGAAWNRLDISDVGTQKLLTERDPTSCKSGEKPPEHYLDYFHCGLLVSPDQNFVADNGWVWAPYGVVASWSVKDWLHDNVWESEDGASKKYLCRRAYFWQGSMCWIDDRHLAVWGYGEDDEWMVPAVCIFDVASGKQVRWFPGPEGTLACDEYLFSWNEGGTSVQGFKASTTSPAVWGDALARIAIIAVELTIYGNSEAYHDSRRGVCAV
ncbi:hypothetical protein [Lignipirellula cremea]|uniref:hypothetical protein n=1 Tax=Lignipirellula cremea TaxID=2528010 RepID=UPI0011A70644|nr:hypothetical protein [Lignipirellula cremea]